MSEDEEQGIKIEVEIKNGVGSLVWKARTDEATLDHAVSLASDDAILAHDLRRLTAEVLVDDLMGRRALQRAGYRLEGRLRDAHERSDGEYVDILVYARLAVDQVYGAGGFSGVMESVLPKKRLISHGVARNSEGKVLLCEVSYKDDWELPGGVVEPSESPRVGGHREIREELGLDLSLGQPALVDWMPEYLGWSDAIEFIFDLGTLTDEQISSMQHDAEIIAYHWVDEADLDDHVTELSARRIRLILSGYTGHTENGYPVE